MCVGSSSFCTALGPSKVGAPSHSFWSRSRGFGLKLEPRDQVQGTSWKPHTIQMLMENATNLFLSNRWQESPSKGTFSLSRSFKRWPESAMLPDNGILLPPSSLVGSFATLFHNCSNSHGARLIVSITPFKWIFVLPSLKNWHRAKPHMMPTKGKEGSKGVGVAKGGGQGHEAKRTANRKGCFFWG